MKKKYGRTIKVKYKDVLLKSLTIYLYLFIPICIIVTCVCLVGFYSSFFTHNWSPLTSLDISLSNQDKYDSLFSPAAALLSGISTILTGIVLILQYKATKNQITATELQYKSINIQKEESIINNFNSQLNMMIAMRTDITKSVVLVDDKGKVDIGKTVFYTLVEKMYGSVNKKKNRFWDTTVQPSKDDIDSIFDDLLEKISSLILLNEKELNTILIDTNSRIEKITKGTLSPFFHNVYTLLRIINENDYLSTDEKNKYFRMVRSHFSQAEFILIYYHALTHIDEGERKFKKLIEDTCFFHSIIQDYIPIKVPIYDDYKNKKHKIGYSYRAFFHSRAEYLEYLKRQRKSKNNQSQNR